MLVPRRFGTKELAALVLGVLVVGAALPTAIRQLPPDSAESIQRGLRAFWSMLFIACGVVHLVRWRLTGESAPALRGSAAIVLGVLSAPVSALAPLMFDSPSLGTISPLSRAIAAAACLSLLTRLRHSPAVDTRVPPIRALWVTLALAGGALAAAMAATRAGAQLDLTPHMWLGLELALTAGWIAMAAEVSRKAHTARRPSLLCLAHVLLLMGVAELLRGVALVTTPRLVLYATGLQLTAGAFALVNAIADLNGVLAATGNRLLLVTSALREAEHHLSAEDEQTAVRRHDVRSILTSLRAASTVLDRFGDDLDEETARRLRESFNTELTRLESMIGRRDDEPVRTFRVDQVLDALVADLPGVDLETDLARVTARGRPGELVAALQSVLAHVVRRSPSGPVRLAVGRSAAGVSVEVEASVPVVTTATTQTGPRTGEGYANELGLYFARRLLREQDAELALSQAPSGQLRATIWLPPASAHDATGAVKRAVAS